jgi:hypothetical protein
MGGVNFGPCSWHEFVDARCGPEIDELVEDVGDVGLRLDVVELARLDQRRDAGPVFGPLVMTSEERVLAIENRHLFILPMSGRSWKSITGGTRISAARLLCVRWSSERVGNSLKCWGPLA